VHDATDAGKRAEQSKSRKPTPEHHSEHQQAAASRDQLHPPPEYQPRRYYRGDIVPGPDAPPFPPPWYDRGPPFAGMPYGPRGPMPPW